MRSSLNTSKLRNGGLVLIGAGLLVLGIVVGVFLLNPQHREAKGESSEGLLPGKSSVVPVEVNFIAPQLRLKDLKGDDASIDDYLGKVILLNNWATWCPPCKEEMPALESFFQAHQEDGFILIAVEAGDPHADVADFVGVYDLSFPVWLDPGNQALQVFKNYGLPNSYVIDRVGTVRLAWTGAISEPMLEKYVTPLIEE